MKNSKCIFVFSAFVFSLMVLFFSDQFFAQPKNLGIKDDLNLSNTEQE